MADKSRRFRALPAALLAAAGVAALVAGFAAGGPDAISGVVFGTVAMAAAGVMLRRP